jgi:hypothetical protein
MGEEPDGARIVVDDEQAGGLRMSAHGQFTSHTGDVIAG